MAGHSKKDWTPLGTGACLTEDADFGLGHILSTDVYKAVFLSLIALTGVTLFAASLNVGETAHLVIAMGIATVKAAVVTLMFMHLNFESKIIWGIVVYPLFIFLLILAGTLGDATIKKSPIPEHISVSALEAERKPSGVQKGHEANNSHKESNSH